MPYLIRLFAGLKERFGQECIAVELPQPVTIETLKAKLEEQYPDQQASVRKALVAVNRQYAATGQVVSYGDELALIPPVGGGDGLGLDSCVITESELSLDAARERLRSPQFGGLTLFAGTVREWTDGRRTIGLEYEAYVEMALTTMREIEAEVKEQFPSAVTIQWHRIGQLQPTDIAVICAAAAPHRDDAFQAARTLIERLKQEVPIWKKEVYADGEVVWQANRPAQA